MDEPRSRRGAYLRAYRLRQSGNFKERENGRMRKYQAKKREEDSPDEKKRQRALAAARGKKENALVH